MLLVESFCSVDVFGVQFSVVAIDESDAHWIKALSSAEMESYESLVKGARMNSFKSSKSSSQTSACLFITLMSPSKY